MIIIIGLGNPGEKFKNTRHNVGFMAVDEFAKKNDFPEFKLNKKFNSLISEKEHIILAKPQTFMNESGKSAKEIFKSTPSLGFIFFKFSVDNRYSTLYQAVFHEFFFSKFFMLQNI